jgi:hypothetical protein
MKRKQRSASPTSRSLRAVRIEELTDRAREAEPLLLSFWDICLENLPEGTFTRSRITPDEAKQRIEEARAKDALTCFSADDLLAPYHKRERHNHKVLVRVLDKHFDIHLGFSDFFSKADEDGLYFSKSLDLARVEGCSRLLVVTCMYVLPDRKKSLVGLPQFRIDPSTVEFHLFEARRKSHRPNRSH